MGVLLEMKKTYRYLTVSNANNFDKINLLIEILELLTILTQLTSN